MLNKNFILKTRALYTYDSWEWISIISTVYNILLFKSHLVHSTLFVVFQLHYGYLKARVSDF